jgi:hypothetical protein
MRAAREARYPAPLNLSHVDQVDVARWDAFEAGYRAALAAREDAPRKGAIKRIGTVVNGRAEGWVVEGADIGVYRTSDGREFLEGWSVEELELIAAAREGDQALRQQITDCASDASLVDSPEKLEALTERLLALAESEVEELPGDGQRPGLHDVLVTAADALDTAASRVLAARAGVRLAIDWNVTGAPVVRDTEREHEADHAEAVAKASWEAKRTSAERPWNELIDKPKQKWRGYVTAVLAVVDVEVKDAKWKAVERQFEKTAMLEQKLAAEHQARVLAKALDEFFRTAGKRYELKAAVEPTLQALGYPKEETSEKCMGKPGEAGDPSEAA